MLASLLKSSPVNAIISAQPVSGVDSGEHDHGQVGNVNHEDHHYGHSTHKQIGYSLVFGFIFMLLVDQISNATGARSRLLHSTRFACLAFEMLISFFYLPDDRSGRNRMGISATIGLVVHAAGLLFSFDFKSFLMESSG